MRRTLVEVKRRYKAGDWFVVPLPSGRAATGIIARASASRLFGYLFAGVVPRERLAGLTPQEAIFRGLISARGIEDNRWRVVATSLRFDAQLWDVPSLRIREPFGRRWARRTIDPVTLLPLETTIAAPEDVERLPDARIFEAEHLERVLDACMDGAPPSGSAFVVVDLHPPFDTARLSALPADARLQIGEPLSHGDAAVLAGVLAQRPQMRLRCYGRIDPPSMIALFSNAPALRVLELDVSPGSVAMLAPLRELRELRLRRASGLDARGLLDHPRLEALSLHGAVANAEALARMPALRELRLHANGWLSPEPLAGALALESLELAYQPLAGLRALHALPALRSLALRHCASLASLRELEGLPLHALTLEALPCVLDLEVLASLPALRSLTVRAMPQLNVADLRVLERCEALRALSVDLGSRRKNREVYRLAGRSASGRG